MAKQDSRGSRRTEVLELLREAPGPLGANDVAERLGIHVNTARFHLDALVEKGSVVVETDRPVGPGRPRAAYRPAPGMDRGGGRGYALLAEILVSQLGSGEDDVAERSREAGRAWGEYLVERPAPYQKISEADALARLEALLTELEFDPLPVAEDGDGVPRSVKLRHCPFLELAERHGRVVCNIHLGLAQGALHTLGAPLTASAVHPFAEPGACRLDTRPTAPPDSP